MTSPLVLDPLLWFRTGRGSERQFFASVAEVQVWLREGLPEATGPYALMGSDMVREGHKYVEVPFHEPIDAFRECIERERHHLFIVSKVLTPNASFENGERIDASCSLQGFVLLQHGLRCRKGLMPSRIAHVRGIINNETGETQTNDGYHKIYLALRKRADRDLCYSTIVDGPNGNKHEEKTLHRMTEGAVALHEQGVQMIARPGKRLK